MELSSLLSIGTLTAVLFIFAGHVEQQAAKEEKEKENQEDFGRGDPGMSAFALRVSDCANFSIGLDKVVTEVAAEKISRQKYSIFALYSLKIMKQQ